MSGVSESHQQSYVYEPKGSVLVPIASKRHLEVVPASSHTRMEPKSIGRDTERSL